MSGYHIVPDETERGGYWLMLEDQVIAWARTYRELADSFNG